MAVTKSDRVGLNKWGAGTDPFTRAQVNEDNERLDEVIDAVFTTAERNALVAADKWHGRRILNSTTNQIETWRQDTAAWVPASTPRSVTTAERDALPAEARPPGTVLYNSTTAQLEVRTASAWSSVADLSSLVPKSVATAAGQLLVGTGASAVGVIAAPSSEGQILKARLAQGGRAAWVADAVMEERTWAIPGEIRVASGGTDYIVPLLTSFTASESLEIHSAYYTLNAPSTGTVTAKIQAAVDAGVLADVAGFTGISIQNSGGTALSPTPVALGSPGSTHRIALVVTAVSGVVQNMTFTLRLRRTRG